MKRKFVPTEEQKAAAAERRAKIKEACKQIAALPVEKRILLANRLGLRTAEGRELSPYNACLLAMQFPTVSIVGGFKQWRAINRCVRKGARALCIWIPLKGAEKTEDGADESDEHRFMLANVFDISQTRGIDEPESTEPAPVPCQFLALPEFSTLRHADPLTLAA
jgi:hypothetical protein